MPRNGFRSSRSAAAAKEQATLDRQIGKLIQWIKDGMTGASVRDELTALESKKVELAATLAAAQRAHRARPLLHPEMGKVYREWVRI